MDIAPGWEPIIRFTSFMAIFAAMGAWEAWLPRRVRAFGRMNRWPSNVGLLAIDVAVLRILAPGAAITVAMVGADRGFGLLNTVDFPVWMEILAAVLFLDLVIYFQHVTFHAVPALWRLHRVHHSDLDFDLTTGIRFHPAEILISTAIKCAAVAAIGAPAIAVLIFEVLLNGMALFNHSNAHLPVKADRFLRWFVVTPDMHRVHHSVHPDEFSRNFGFNAPWWDRMFGTYSAQPKLGHDAMVIGTPGHDDPSALGLGRLLMQPLRTSDTERAKAAIT